MSLKDWPTPKLLADTAPEQWRREAGLKTRGEALRQIGRERFHRTQRTQWDG